MLKHWWCEITQSTHRTSGPCVWLEIFVMIAGTFRPRSTSNRFPLRLLSSSVGIVGMSTGLRSLSGCLSTVIASDVCAGAKRVGGTCWIRPLGEPVEQITEKNARK